MGFFCVNDELDYLFATEVFNMRIVHVFGKEQLKNMRVHYYVAIQP